MLAQQDRPTPVPTGDDEDDATLVWQESPIVDGGAGMAALASTPTGAVVHDRQTLTKPLVAVRDTIVGAPALPLWLRLKAGWASFWNAVADAFFGGTRVSERLPPVPPPRSREVTGVSFGNIADHEHGEFLLLEVVLAAPLYQRAAIEVAREALAARREGEAAYTNFVTHLALSRLRPDKDGRVSVARLREKLPHLPYERMILPALVRLEEQGVVMLVQARTGDPMAEILREGVTHVELRVPV
ncbi:hypothetical protein [Polyangium mundeleinium]|uniref:Uncharacterized protein n=1 Tax=Polyangium mundeleinium TaxID=2995306 RepID=A0ABT5F1N9_9BACT|nr:hypothetical protein [Polyangium mundeleinium]MDC0747509.1 hypothetical protein [Polyangium mundeleinium]